MIDFQKYFTEASKKFKFVIKLAQKPNEEQLKDLEAVWKRKGMTKTSAVQESTFMTDPIDFPRLKDFCGYIYTFNVEFEYPVTDFILKTDINNILGIQKSYIVVRSADSVDEEYIENTILDEETDNDYESLLMNEVLEEETKVKNTNANEYLEKLVKQISDDNKDVGFQPVEEKFIKMEDKHHEVMKNASKEEPKMNVADNKAKPQELKAEHKVSEVPLKEGVISKEDMKKAFLKEAEERPMIDEPDAKQFGKFVVKILMPGMDGNTSKEPQVRFYDASADTERFGKYGQATPGLYYAETLLTDSEGIRKNGLCIDGGVPAWDVSAEEISQILPWIEETIAKLQKEENKKPEIDESLIKIVKEGIDLGIITSKKELNDICIASRPVADYDLPLIVEALAKKFNLV